MPKYASTSRANKKSFNLNYKTTEPWIPILGLSLFSALLILARTAKILNLAFPLGSLLVGIVLYLRYPVMYVGFTWWLWFLTPLVRRFIDYYSSFTDPSPVLLSPILVTLITLATFLQKLPSCYRQGGLPFIMCVFGVFYAFLTGLIQNSIQGAILGFLDWFCPILFGFYLFINWQYYPQYRRNFQRVFLWGVVVMGLYGVWQFLVAPQWDTFWLINSEVSSFGRPQPLQIRVWSTMNGPQAFAATLMAGLLLLFINKGSLRFVGTGAGYLSFLLSQARAPWLGFLAGLMIFIPSLKSSLQIRIIVSILLAALVVTPLTTIEPFATTIGSRFETLSNAEEDNSLQDRSEGYSKLLGEATSEFIGKGLGYKIEADSIGSNDGSVIPTLFSLGWLGTLPYLSGIFLIVFQLFQGKEAFFDPFASAARAIVLGTLAQSVFNFVFVAPIGIVLWGFLGIGLAAHFHYQHQKIYQLVLKKNN